MSNKLNANKFVIAHPLGCIYNNKAFSLRIQYSDRSNCKHVPPFYICKSHRLHCNTIQNCIYISLRLRAPSFGNLFHSTATYSRLFLGLCDCTLFLACPRRLAFHFSRNNRGNRPDKPDPSCLVSSSRDSRLLIFFFVVLRI